MPGPPLHKLEPCALLHALPHEAQFVVVPSGVSQPAAAVQSAEPALQEASEQTLLMHCPDAFG